MFNISFKKIMMSRPRCATGVKRPKSPKRGQISDLILENYVTTGRPTLVCEIMENLDLSRSRVNEIIQAMEIRGEIRLLSTNKKGQAQQILPVHALLPGILLNRSLSHGKEYLRQSPDRLLLAKFCEILIEINARKNITFKTIEEYGRTYGILERSSRQKQEIRKGVIHGR
jgi:hypothetical protein